MKTYAVLEDLAIRFLRRNYLKKESGRQKMVQRAKTLITFGARVPSCSLIWFQHLGTLAPKVMEEIKKYDD